MEFKRPSRRYSHELLLHALAEVKQMIDITDLDLEFAILPVVVATLIVGQAVQKFFNRFGRHKLPNLSAV